MIEVRPGPNHAEVTVDPSSLGAASGELSPSRIDEIALQVAIELGMVDVGVYSTESDPSEQTA